MLLWYLVSSDLLNVCPLQGLLPCGQSASDAMGHQEVWDSHPVNHSKGGRKW